MQKRHFSPAVIALTAGLALAFNASAKPEIVGDNSNQRCQVAHQMAVDAFLSDSPLLYWPITAPSHLDHHVVLSRKARDISGGDGIVSDPVVFERIEPSGRSLRAIHWQKEPFLGHRIVVVTSLFSWRGDRYDTYLFKAGVPTTSLDDMFSNAERAREASSNLLHKEKSWNPHVLVLDRQAGEVWGIDQGEAFEILGPWRIDQVTATGVTSPCEIIFWSGKKSGLELLPDAVKKLASSLDEALGPGLNEGTLNPTHRIRHNVERGWSLVSVRPWALNLKPSNSRAEVETGLKTWSTRHNHRARLYQEIFDQIQPAQDALAGYYISKFALEAEVAKQFSRYAMDIMFRAYFVFPREGLSPVSARNPWPDETH